MIKTDEAVQLVTKCVPSYSERYTLLWKVHATHKTILLFKHYTRLLTTLCEVQKTGLHCNIFFRVKHQIMPSDLSQSILHKVD